MSSGKHEGERHLPTYLIILYFIGLIEVTRARLLSWRRGRMKRLHPSLVLHRTYRKQLYFERCEKTSSPLDVCLRSVTLEESECTRDKRRIRQCLTVTPCKSLYGCKHCRVRLNKSIWTRAERQVWLCQNKTPQILLFPSICSWWKRGELFCQIQFEEE